MRVNFTVNGRQQKPTTSGRASPSSTSCVSAWACPAPRTPASRASAVPAPSAWTASRSARAWWPPDRSRAARSSPSRCLADYAKHREDAHPGGGCASGACGTTLASAKRWQARPTDGQTGEAVELAPIQQAFIDAGAVQCGFCTPGLLVAADELLENTLAVRPGHPRGALRQPVPLHRLREDPRRGPPRGRPPGRGGPVMTTRPEATTRPAATMPKAQNTPSGTPTKITQGSPTKRAASASPRSAPTAPSRSPASSRTPPTCGTRTCCGARPCAPPSPTRRSSPSTPPRRWPPPASTR